MDLLRIPIWQEARVAFERAALRRDPVLRGQGVPRGDGAPVLLIPGFLAGDLTLSVMAGWLGRLGYEPCRAGMRANVDCTTRALDRLETQMERLADRHARRVTIVGHSRGGSMARVLAVRRPDLVDGIICLGSPLTDQLAVHPFVRVHVEAVATLGELGVPGFFSRACADGPCCAQSRTAAAAEFPSGVRFTSIYTRSDGIVDWHSCLDPAAEQIEVHSSHCGMAVNHEVFTAVGRALAPVVAVAARRSRVRAVRAAGAIAA
jgi:pimeloyl-ACP methyl ester carboxylesterase